MLFKSVKRCCPSMDGISFRTLQNTALKMINVLRTELVRCIKSMGDFLYLRYILLGTTTKKKKKPSLGIISPTCLWLPPWREPPPSLSVKLDFSETSKPINAKFWGQVAIRHISRLFFKMNFELLILI